jgi:hypothetical protein
MRKIQLRRPSAGVVLGTLALVVAVAGNSGAFAGTKVIVRKGEIAKGAVTAKALGNGAVHPKALAKGSVTAAAIRPGAIGPAALAPDAVTSGALATGSVYAGSLGETTLHSAPILDADTVPANNEWTASVPVTALCGPGERVLSGGVVFTTVANREIGIVTSQPFVNGANSGWVGAITTNAGGLAKAEVQALCLK